MKTTEEIKKELSESFKDEDFFESIQKAICVYHGMFFTIDQIKQSFLIAKLGISMVDGQLEDYYRKKYAGGK